MKIIIKILLISALIIFNVFVIHDSYCATNGASELWIARIDTGAHNAFVNNEIEFQVYIDTNGEKITGVAFFLTIDPTILQPIFDDHGRPFTPGQFLNDSYAVFNGTHRDSLHISDTSNGISGFQLDYYQPTGIAYNGQRPFAIGSGIVASFRLRVVGITDSNTITSVNFDFDDSHGRLTTYYKLNQSGFEQRFREATGYWLTTTYKTDSKENQNLIPDQYNLAQNYPNPFNSLTQINYKIPEAGFVSLSIYNILGKKIKVLVNEQQDIGKHNICWQGDNGAGNDMQSGIYFYKLTVNNYMAIFKMMLLR